MPVPPYLPSRPQQGPDIDRRAVRFAAWTTSGVLALVLVTGSLWLLAAQAVVFALGAAGRSPHAPLWRRWAQRRRLGPPRELEDRRPVQFAQLVGLVCALAGLLGAGSPLTYVVVAGALVAALLNAAYGICLGCSLYLSWVRLTSPHDASPHGASPYDAYPHGTSPYGAYPHDAYPSAQPTDEGAHA